MSIEFDLTGHSFKTTIYKSVVGSIEVETEILADGSISTALWVVYPDGVGEEIFTLGEGLEKLEIS
jgi:hypothetical protein